jgi:hypothetical protein
MVFCAAANSLGEAERESNALFELDDEEPAPEPHPTRIKEAKTSTPSGLEKNSTRYPRF